MATLSQFFPGGGIVPSNAIPIELLVVAGGGSTSGSNAADPNPGAGAGRVFHAINLYVLPGVSYTVTVGAGGSSSKGGNSSFGSNLLCYGGGRGSAFDQTNAAGGSAGGGTYYGGYSSGRAPDLPSLFTPGNSNASADKLYINESTIIKDLGNSADAFAFQNLSRYGSSGGGGAVNSGMGLAGAATDTYVAFSGVGGSAYSCGITGSDVYYGGGGTAYSSLTIGMQNNNNSSNPYFSTQSNTGRTNQGFAAGGTFSGVIEGGSGIVVVAYSSSLGAASTTGSPLTPTRTNYRVYRFTGSGSITFPS